MLKAIVIAASLAASTAALVPAAFAQGSHLTDGQYLTAVRCRALIASPALGKGDTSAIDAVLKTESANRTPTLLDRASEVKSDASRQAVRAEGDQKTQLMAERSGMCESFGATSTTAAQMTQPSGAN